MNKAFGTLFILTGIFAIAGGLYTWGDGILSNKSWGQILGINVSGIYVFGSMLVFISIFWNKDYSVFLIVPALSGLLIGLGYTVLAIRSLKQRNRIV